MRPISKGEVVQFNVFVPKAGMMDAFIETQRTRLPGFGATPGLLNSRLYRGNAGRDAILVSTWESELAQQRFLKSAAFSQQRALLQPLLDSSIPAFYTLVFAREGSEVLAF